MIIGQCDCSAVQYEVRGGIEKYCHCHCSICRKIHGAAFVTWGAVARGAFRWAVGDDILGHYSYSERSESVFCKNCSSTLLVDFQTEPHRLYITLGTVDGDVDLPEGYHQFVGSKAPWFEISDDLPKHDGWADDTSYIHR
jgi:hypothetical protein